MFNDFPTVVSQLGSFQVFVQFPTAPGVLKDTPVNFCGYPIGRVTRVMAPAELTDLNTHLRYYQTKVILSISDRYVNIPSNVKVKLMTRGLGSSFIELSVDPTLPLKPLDPNDSESVYLLNGMTLQGSTGMTSEFFPEESQRKLEELINGITAFINNANEILGDKANKENISTTLANMAEATAELKVFLVSGVGTSEQMSKTAAEMRQVLEKINEGKGTTGKLINDARLYEKLLENADELEVLLKDMREMVAEYKKKGIKVKLK
jgi:ABC-type transporter Mla subunit MlaD